MIHNARENRYLLGLYRYGLQICDWMHVRNRCAAIVVVLEKGRADNIGGNNEKAKIEIVRLILSELGKPESLITHVQDRPGHDRRYAIDNTKSQQSWAGYLPIPLSRGFMRRFGGT